MQIARPGRFAVGAVLAACILALALPLRAPDAQTASALTTPTANAAKYRVGDKYSGYTYADPSTQAMQDDDFANPGFLWVQEGEALWSKPDGAANKACADCHGKAEETMKRVGATYPKWQDKLGKLENIEQRINQCRVDNQQAEPWAWESRALLAMTAYVRTQSRGEKVDVSIDGPAKPHFENGEKLYYTRHGQLDLSCANCHEDNSGNWIRGDLLGQSMANGFPTYRLREQKLISLQFRLIGCVRDTRAEPYDYGSPEYLDLELYLAHRAKDLPVEAPSVRR